MNISLHILVTILFQLTFNALAILQMFFNPQFYCVLVLEASIPNLFTRFICATILHLQIVEEVQGGITPMKYAANHPYKFVRYRWAFTCGYFKAIAGILVEVASIGVICAADNTIEIGMNFIALAIVADFDDIVLQSMKSESYRLLMENQFIEKALIINHTTSKVASDFDLSDQLDEQGNKLPLKIRMKNRSCCNAVMYVLYKSFRIFYVSIFFYFGPFSVIILSTILPILNRGGIVVCEERIGSSFKLLEIFRS